MPTMNWVGVAVVLVALVGMGQGCRTASDCSLNGECLGGGCKCDAGWRGTACDKLAVTPTQHNFAYHNHSAASWGGNAVYAAGRWHMFVAQMAGGCPLSDYGTHSMVVRAESDTPLGPYVFREVVVPQFAHNPTVRHFNGSYYLFMIGSGTGGSNASCGAVRGSKATPSSIYTTRAPSVFGPWEPVREVVFSTTGGGLLDCAFTNPSPHFEPSGEVLLAFQAGFCHQHFKVGTEVLGVARAPQWGGTYQVITNTPVFGNPPPWCVAGNAEDPFLWRTPRGYHIISHGMCYAPLNSKHAFSLDGVHWTASEAEPYSYLVSFTDAPHSTLFARVERPQLVFNGSSPVALMTGVCVDGLKCLSSPGMTWTLARPLAV